MGTIVFMKWDGVCFPDKITDAESKTNWCHAPSRGVAEALTPPDRPRGLASAMPSSSEKQGSALSVQAAEVSVLSVAPFFAPAEEHCIIQISVKDMSAAGCLVMQVRDKDGKLVYAERLTQKQIWALHGSRVAAQQLTPFGHPLASHGQIEDDADKRARKRVERRKRKWASPEGGPYSFTFWITSKICTDNQVADQIPLDISDVADGITKNSVKKLASEAATNDEGATEDKDPMAGKTAVKTVFSFKQLPWEDLYKAVSGRADTKDPGSGSAPLRRMWAQYKLNELGYWAGPVDGTDNDDLKKAVRRFRMAHPKLSKWDVGPFYKPNGSDPKNYEMVVDPSLPQNSPEVDEALADALTKTPPTGVKRVVASNPGALDDETKDTKLLVDVNRFFIGEQSQFNRSDGAAAATNKQRIERDWLSQPHVPFVARVSYVDSDGRERPADVDGLAVQWTWSDHTDADLEKADLIPKLADPTDDEPTQSKKYIPRTKVDLAKDKAYNNAVDVAGGTITADHAANVAVAFAPGMAPLEKNDTGVIVKTTTAVDSPLYDGACVAYLKTSTIAGDSYRVTAQLLSSKDKPNKTSGRAVIWRRVHLAAYVHWPKRDGFSLSSELDKVAAEFALGMVVLEKTGMQEYGAKDVIKTADFESIIDRGEVGDVPAPRRAMIKKAGFSEKSIVKGSPDVHPDPGNVGDAANALMRADYFGRMAATGPCVLAELGIAMRIATEWSKSAVGKVAAAGNHWKTELGKVLEADAAKTGQIMEWKLKNDGVKTLAPLVDATDLNLEIIEGLLLPKMARDELDAYVADTNGTAKPTFFANFLSHVRTAYSKKEPTAEKKPSVMQLKTNDKSLSLEDAEAIVKAWKAPVIAPYTDFALLDKPGLLKSFYEIYSRQLLVVMKGTTAFNFTPGVDRKALFIVRRVLLDKTAYELMMGSKMHIAERIDERARAKLASEDRATDGAIILDFSTHEPTTLDGAPYMVPGAAFGGINGVAMIDQSQVSQYYSLLAHEMAHCMTFQHGKNAPSTARGDHDGDDDNCMMSYPIAMKKSAFDAKVAEAQLKAAFPTAVVSPKKQYCWESFKPHFCGKCNLKLRGWNLRAPGVPLSADAPPPPPPPVKPVTVKVIAGSLDDAAKAAKALDRAPISFYPSNKCGPKAADAFPTAFGHDAKAAADPGAFRVEVIDENATTDTVKVTLEALMPIYEGATPSEWMPFDDQKRPARALIEIDCKQLAADKTCFRSRYLRLVTDEKDHEALAGTKQGLLVTDIADGGNADADKVEILDQKVAVIYDPTPLGPTTEGEMPVASLNAVVTSLEVGLDPSTRKRIKLFFHLVDSKNAKNEEKSARLRTMKWVRRAYASANMSPKILGFDTAARPGKNTLTIASRGAVFDDKEKKPAAKAEPETPVQKTAGKVKGADTQSKISLHLRVDATDYKKDVPLTADLLPIDIAAAIVQALDGGVSATVHQVPAATDEYGHPPSADVVFAHTTHPIEVVAVTHDDRSLPAWALYVPEIAPNFANLGQDDTYSGGSSTQRMILRSAKSADDRIDVFVVPNWALPGRAYPDYADDLTVTALNTFLKPKVADACVGVHVQKTPVDQTELDKHLPKGWQRRAIIVSSTVMDGGESSPFTLPHEIAHVLGDMGHLKDVNDPWVGIDLMSGNYPKVNDVGAAKRILSAPLLVKQQHMVNQLLPTADSQIVNDADVRNYLHTRGGRHLTDAW